MQNPLFKLTALVGVIGAGALVVVEAQKQLSRQEGPEVAETFTPLAESAPSPSKAVPPAKAITPAKVLPAPDAVATNTADSPPLQSEPGESSPAEPTAAEPFPFLFAGANQTAPPPDAKSIVAPDPRRPNPAPSTSGAEATPEESAEAIATSEPLASAEALPEPIDTPDKVGSPFALAQREEPLSFPDGAEKLPTLAEAGTPRLEIPAEEEAEESFLKRFPAELDAPILLTPPAGQPVVADSNWPAPEADAAALVRQQSPEGSESLDRASGPGPQEVFPELANDASASDAVSQAVVRNDADARERIVLAQAEVTPPPRERSRPAPTTVPPPQQADPFALPPSQQ